MTTYTVAQALATPASGIVVADTAANIASNLSNTSLVSRVTLFSMSANGAVAAWEAAALAAIGSKFSTAGHTLTVRDTVAQLTSANAAAGLTISGIVVAVQDTAADILAAISNPIISHASSVALTANATLSLAQLIMLESLSSLSAAGLTLTLSDTAGNLLAFTPAEAKPALTVFQVGISSSVTAAQAIILEGMSHFGIANGVTLTICDSLANLATDLSALHAVLLLSGTTVNVADTLTNLLAQATTFQWNDYPSARATLSTSATATVSQVATLVALPGFGVASGQSLTIADTVGNLVTLTAGEVAVAAAIRLSGSDTATVAQLAMLADLVHFSPGYALTVDDTLAHLATLTPGQYALTSAETIDDTVTNLLAAQPASLSGAGAIVAELDGTTLDAAQAIELAALAAHATLTLHANGNASTLTISDTAQNLIGASASVTTLEADGPVTVVTTSDTDRTILTASAAAAVVQSGVSPATATLAVADSGSALSAVAGIIFGQGFEAITVTSGSFAGTLAQLLDPTLHFVAGTSAQLATDAIASVVQALELATLPGFNRASDVTLVVYDSISNILAEAAALPAIANSILANDTEIVSAAAAATLATLAGFSLHGNYLILNDTAANIAAATPGAIALATTVDLTSDARISASVALQFVDMGLAFSPNGFFMTIADTAANLETLAASASTRDTVNGWNGEAVLSADATVTVANAVALDQLAGFNVGTQHLTIADSAAHLLAASDSVLALASALQLSQPSTVTAATAANLEALQNFTANGFLTIADTPADLAAMQASVAAQAITVTLAAEVLGAGGNASGFAIDATQFAAMMALPNVSLSNFTGTVAITDTAAALAALTPSLEGLSATALSHITTTLSASATVSVNTVEALYGLPGFSLGSSGLTISDSVSALTSLYSGTAALASAIEISTPVTVEAATASSLAALHNFTTDVNPITIADTPANLAAMSLGTASIAAADLIVPITAQTTADYTLDATQFLDLVRNLVAFPAYAGPLIVQDTALHLASLAGAFIGASPTAPISQSRSVLATYLSASTTVNTEIMAYLIGMPGFSLDGHTLILQDTPTALIQAFSTVVPYATEVELAANASAWIVTALQAAQLAAIGPLNAGPAGMIVSDSVTNLLTASYASGVDAATATTLDQDSVVTVAMAEALHALPNFNRGSYTLVISDTASNLATLDAATTALASSVVTIGGSSSLSVAAFDSLVEAPGFSGIAASLTVSDSASQLLTLVGSSNLTYIESTVLSASATLTAGNAKLLSTLPNLLIGNNLAIADTASNLLHITGAGSTPDDWAITLQATSVRLTANASGLTAPQAALLEQLGTRFSNGGYTVTVQDSPTALLALGNGLGAISSQLTSITLTSGTWTIDLTQAAQLATLPAFTPGSAGVIVADSVSNLAASANANLIASLIANIPNVTFTLAGNDMASVAQAETLHALGSAFSRGSYTLAIMDSAAHLATLDSGSAALATSIDLQGSTVTSVANFQAIRALPNYSNDGNMLLVSDTATHLLELVGTDVLLATELMLSTPATNLSAAQAEQLVTLSNFTSGIAHFTILDSAADLLQITGNGAEPDDWAAERTASAITLNGNATISSTQADQLALLGSRFSVGSYTLTVADNAANLLSRANSDGLALAGTVTLSGNETALSAANATQLAALSNFDKGAYHITVSDIAANLAFAGNAAGLALADHVRLSQATSMTVAAAESLIGMANFQANNTAPITIDDTLSNLLGLASANLAHNAGILATTPIELSTTAVATVAQMEALAVLAQYSTFSLNGNTITVEDSGRHLATYTPDSIAIPSAIVMIGDATLNATQAGLLAAENLQIGDNNLTVADTPTALLGLSAAVNALATGLELSAAATATAAQATALEALAVEQRFTTGGYALTVAGSASALLGLSAPTQQMATTLALSESGDSVSVASLVQLTELGSKFSLNNHTLTVSDTAAQLATLNNLETPLVSAAVLGNSATVNTTTATELAALPDFSLGNGVTLIVQGSYAGLETLPGSITSIATLELTGGGQTLTAAEASALAGLSNFSPGGDLVVQDTIADLNAGANAGWHAVATGGYIVTDSISNLLNNASSVLLTEANSVTLLGDAQVNATTFATLSAITNFSRGSFALTVEDSALTIATNATEIALLASSAIIDQSTPVSAQQAEALAVLNTAHMLSFTGGVLLAVQDSFAELTSANNAAGLALANTVTVLGTGAQLVSATAHNWGSIAPYFEVNVSGTITAPQATTLQGLGGHYLPDGYTLTVVDGASAIVGSASAIAALGLLAQVSDSVADVAAEATQLGTLGSALQSITLTDSSPVGAGTVSGLVPLAAKLIAPAITVSDTASSVDTNLAALEALGTHVSSITVSDSAAQVADYAAALSALGSKLHITLSDPTPVTLSADVAAGLEPVAAFLGGIAIDVSDTGAHIAGDAATLAELGSVLGTVTLSDGTATNAPTAAALAQIDSHLGNGVKFSVTDTVAAIAGAASGLGTLVGDDRISSITANGQTVADVLAYSPALLAIGATATISDSAAHVSAHLDALDTLSGNGGVITQITLNDGGTPDIALSLQQITADADVFGRITGSFKYAISDSAADIIADLGAGGSSRILTLGSAVDTITVSNSGTLTLTASALLATGVDDGASSALTKLTGGVSVAVTGVTVGDLADFGALAVVPGSVYVADSGSHIATDLGLGSGSSTLLAYRTSITSITPTGTITLNYATASAAHVDDGAGSVFAKMPSATLDVSGVPVTGIASLFTTNVHAASITVTDAASAISGDLETASPALVQYISQITAITVSPSSTVTLDAGHALASSVDDSAGSVFGKMTGGTLAVTGAEVDQLNALHALYVGPDSVAVSDTVSAIESDLMQGATSLLEVYAADGMLTSIAATDDPVVLDSSYVGAVAAALTLLPADSLRVTSVPIADVASVAGLSALLSMSVSDTATHIKTDLLLGGSSELALHHALISSVAMTGGPISLTDAQALAAASTALGLLPSDEIVVTDVAVGDIASIAAIAALSTMTVSDAAGAIHGDLILGAGSVLEQNRAVISGISFSSGSAVALTDAQAELVLAALALLPAGSLTVSNVSISNIPTIDALPALSSMTVQDTTGNIRSDLILGASSVLEQNHAEITGIAFSSGTSVALTDTQADLVLAVLALLPAASLTVSNISIADVSMIAALSSLTNMTVQDSASHVQSDLLQGVSSTLEENAGQITGISFSGGTSVALTDAQADPVLAALAYLPAGSLTVSAVSVADIPAIGALSALSGMTVSDSAAHIKSDLILDASSQLALYHAVITGVTVTGGPISLTDAQALGAEATALALLPSGGLDVTGVAVGDIAGVAAIGAPLAGMTVSDAASTVTTDLELGASNSELELQADKINSVTLTSGSVTLSDTDAWAVTAALAKLPAGSLTLTGVAVGHISTYVPLSALASMTVADTASAVHSDLTGNTSALETYAATGEITAITVNDSPVSLTDMQAEGVLDALAILGGTGGLTVLGVSVADIPTVGGLSALTGMTVSDSNTDIHNDLVLGTSSELYQHRGVITGVTVTGGQVNITTAEVPDVELAALALLPADTLVVTGVLVSGVTGMAGLAGLYRMTVSDSASHVQSDLELGAASALETNHALIASITVAGGPVTLSDSEADAVLTALALLNGPATLVVTDVPVADVATIGGLGALGHMTVSDTAVDVHNDLVNGDTSVLELNVPAISTISFSSGSSVALSDIEANAVLAALAKLPADSLTISAVPLSDIATFAALSALASMSVADTASAVHSDLISGHSVLETDVVAGTITGITVNDATVALTDTQAEQVLDALAVLGGAGGLTVSSVAVTDLATIGALSALTGMTVSDSAAHLKTDLLLDGSSELALYHAVITAVTVTGGPISLTDAQAIAAEASALALLPADSLAVTGVAVGDIADVAAIGAPLGGMTISDTAGDITTDLELGAASSELELHASKISSVLITGGSVSLSDTDAWAVTAALAKLPSASLAISDAAVAHVATYGGLSALTTMTVADTASAVQGDLASGGSKLATYAASGVISSITVNDATVALTDTQAEQVLDALAVLDGSGGLTVSAVSVADIPTIGGLAAITGMTVSDSNTDIHNDLVLGASSALYQYRGLITGVTVTGGQVDIATSEVPDVELAALALLPPDALVVTGVLVSGVAGLAGLTGLYQMTVSDSASHVQADFELGASSVLETNHALLGSITVTGGPVTLTDSQADAVLDALALLNGPDTLVVTGVSLGDVATIAGFSALGHMTVGGAADDVHNDLVNGASSVLEQNAASISAISFNSGSSIALTDTQANNVLAALAKLPTASLTISAVSVGDVATFGGLAALASMAVADTASAVRADLVSGHSALETYTAAGTISTITVNDAAVALTDTQAETVLDALAFISGSGGLTVSGVTVADIPTIGVVPALTTMTVSDSAAHIKTDLLLDASSELALYNAVITGVTVTGGPISLTDAQALAAETTALALLPFGCLDVTGVAVGDIADVAAIGAPLSGMTVSDSGSDITTDLALGASSSELELHAGKITSVAISSGSVSLSDTAAWAVTAALAKLPSGSLTISDAAVAHVATYGALAALASMSVADTASAVQSDLAAGTSELGTYAAAGVISSITVTDAAVALTDTQAEQVLDALAVLTGSGGLTVSGVPVADIATIGVLSALTGMTVSDSNTDVLNDLVLGTSSELYQYRDLITSVAVTGGRVSIASNELADVQLAALALLPADTLVVTAAPVSAVTGLAGLTGLYQMTVNDASTTVHDDLVQDASSVLETHHALIGSISMTGGTLVLNDTDAETVLDALALLSGSHVLLVQDVPVAHVATIAAIAALDHMTISDTTSAIHADLLNGGTSVLEQYAGSISAIGFSGGSSIALTGTQAAPVMDALAELPGDSLTVSDAAVSQVHALGVLSSLVSMTVSDTAAHIASDLALGASSQLEENAASITSIGSTSGTIVLPYADVSAVTAALGKLSSGALTVDNVPVADVNTIAGLGMMLVNMTVLDTGSHVQADLNLGASSVLESNDSSITSIGISSGVVTLTDGAADLVTSALALLPSSSLSVTGVPVSDIATIFGLGAPLTGMTVTDTGGDVTTDLISGGAIEAALSKIAGISLSSGTVALTNSQASDVTSALAKLPADSLTVSAVPLADVASVAGYSALSSMAVSGTGSAVTTDLALGASSVLATYASQISTIALTSGSVSLTDSQADAAFSALGKLPDGSLTVTGVPVSDVAHIDSLGAVLAGLSVQDSASHVQADLASGSVLVSAGTTISAISLSSGTVTLTDAQAHSAMSVLNKLPADSLTVTGVPVSDIATIAALASLNHMTVVDSTALIVADIDGAAIIAANIAAISSVAISGSSIDATDATTIYEALGSRFAEGSLTISDTASALLSTYGSEPGVLSAASAVTLSANASGISAANATTLHAILGGSLDGKTLAVTDTASDLLNAAYAAGIDFATTVQLSNTLSTNAATATELAGLHGFTAGPAITVQDSPTNLLSGANAAGLAIATTVEPDQAYTVTATTLAALALISGFSAGGQSITVSGHASDIIGLSPSALSFTTLAHVTDSSATIAADLGSLQSAVSAHGDAMSITLTDGTPGTPTIFIDAAAYTADQGAIDSITTAGAVNVTDGAAALAAIGSELASDSVVGQVDVDDTAANILSNLTVLESIGSKFVNATITDTSLNASEISALLTIPNLQSGAVTISDTGSQIAAAIEANGAAGLAFLNAQTVVLSANSVIAASDAVLLEQLNNLNKNGYALVVWDTASHLTDSVDGYLAAEKNGLMTAVYLKTTNGTATITAATASTLLSIPTFSKDNPPVSLGGNGAANILTLSDTAAHIDAAFSALYGHTSSLSSIVVSGSATVTDSVYADLLTLGAVMANGQSLTVRDTAATIIADAPGQLSGSHSITPTTWQLSASATVTEAGAAYLGALAGLSLGAYTLTLSASDPTTSESDANAIGTLGSAFHLGSYHLTVSGSVSYVSGLTTNARLIVTSDITDNFSQIATLTLGDGLLDGTITVNDSEAITTTQASNFLALLGGSGIPVANVSFGGHVETITDTLGDIQTLTGSAAWTSNTGVHGDFSLVVADTVATLIISSNTATLAGMHGTTLNSDQTVNAASAESLFALESTINFSLGSYAVTIQDTAADLLNPVYSDGLALAAVWQLSGSDSVNAAGAETLLPAAQFHLNHLLTVSDTSDNLLDGVLSGVITAADSADAGYGGSVHVTLSDSETLDANTAEALVSLPGFQNTGELSIADDSSYLLNPNNLAAETDATSVSLAGDETMSAATMGKLAALPNFMLGANTVTLASNDYANAATLKAIADFGSGYQSGGFTLTMTQDNVSLTPTEYTALQSDNVLQNGHALSAMPIGASVSSSSGNVFLTATGVSGATLNVYAASGSELHSSTLGSASISVTQADALGTVGGAVVVTETMSGHSAATAESAPVIAIDQTVITTDAGAASFSSSGGTGMVQVGINEYMHLYTAGSQPASPANPVLVYDPSAHTLSFDVTSTSIVLVTLGAQTHPTSLDPAEIFITHFA